MEQIGLGADVERKLRNMEGKDLSVEAMAKNLGITPAQLERRLQSLEKIGAMKEVLTNLMDQGSNLLPWLEKNKDGFVPIAYDLTNTDQIKTIPDLIHTLRKYLDTPELNKICLTAPSIDGDQSKIETLKEGFLALCALQDHPVLDQKFEAIKQGFKDLKAAMEEAKELPEFQEMKALNDKLKVGGSLSQDEIERMRELAQDPDLVKVLRNMQEKELYISKISDFDFHILLDTHPERKSDLQAIAEQFKPLTQELEEQYPEPADLRFLLRRIESALEKDQAPFKIAPLEGFNTYIADTLESDLKPSEPAKALEADPVGHHRIRPELEPVGPGM
ncbi:MAG: hypothetical protein L6Q57_07365 [Alphaproteobacteria bacterium]|nr:hypothetical protein [Alphaproteobacteria bacterium]